MKEHKVKIIVPITGADEETIMKEAKTIAETEADCVEWRVDLAKGLCNVGISFMSDEPLVDMYSDNIEEILKRLSRILKGKELLLTIRTEFQGGEFPYNPQVYERLVCDAIKSGFLSMVDLEDSTEKDVFERIMKLAKESDVKTVVSYHDFSRTPEVDVILEKFRRIRSTGADIIKTAYWPLDPEDVAAVLLATAKFKEEDEGQHELITMSMGNLGRVSRVSGGVFGSDYTFATVGETSAPGQMPIEKVIEMMEVLNDNLEEEDW